MEGEEHGLSVFFRLDDDVFHTYSAYARGTESLTDAYRLLDTTPYGRQQDFEDSPRRLASEADLRIARRIGGGNSVSYEQLRPERSTAHKARF